MQEVFRGILLMAFQKSERFFRIHDCFLTDTWRQPHFNLNLLFCCCHHLCSSVFSSKASVFHLFKEKQCGRGNDNCCVHEEQRVGLTYRSPTCVLHKQGTSHSSWVQASPSCNRSVSECGTRPAGGSPRLCCWWASRASDSRASAEVAMQKILNLVRSCGYCLAGVNTTTGGPPEGKYYHRAINIGETITWSVITQQRCVIKSV